MFIKDMRILPSKDKNDDSSIVMLLICTSRVAM